MVEKWIRRTLICDALDVLFPGLLLLREWENVWGQWEETFKCMYAFIKKENPIFKAGDQVI